MLPGLRIRATGELRKNSILTIGANELLNMAGSRPQPLFCARGEAYIGHLRAPGPHKPIAGLRSKEAKIPL